MFPVQSLSIDSIYYILTGLKHPITPASVFIIMIGALYGSSLTMLSSPLIRIDSWIKTRRRFQASLLYEQG